jgi:hypothetical protein
MTTQSNPKWWLCWLVGGALALAGWYAFERTWRANGYVATVMDSNDLWAQQRDRVAQAAPPLRVALLGASRIQFGLSPQVFRDEAKKLGTDVEALMLAINGHYPLAALRDLAGDETFNGVAIVGIDSRGFQKRHREMQEKWIGFYRHDWTPARDLHRTLLTEIQRFAIAARPDFSWSNLLARHFNGHGLPSREYVTFYADRSGGTDYSRSDIALVRDARIRDLRDYYATTPAEPASQWLDNASEVITWVNQIKARGGQVVFYREPVSGEHLVLDETRFPRAEFWDALSKEVPATMIDFRDHPELNFATPDTSHIDAKDIEPHTRGFVRVLASAGVFAPK